MINRFSVAFVAMLASLTFSSVEATDPTIEMLAKSSSNSSPFAYIYASSAQIGIGPGDVIKFTDLGYHGKNYDITQDGGVYIKKKGYYLIQFQALISSQASIALYRNGNLLEEAAFSNISTTAPITGNVIVALDNRDVLTIRSIENYKTFNTLAPSTITATTIPVAMTLQQLDN